MRCNVFSVKILAEHNFFVPLKREYFLKVSDSLLVYMNTSDDQVINPIIHKSNPIKRTDAFLNIKFHFYS